MAIVARGLGLPEDGSLVAAGLGTTEADPNAMVAALSGSGSITATLTAADDTPDTTEGGGRPYRQKFRLERKPRQEFVITDDDLAAILVAVLEAV